MNEELKKKIDECYEEFMALTRKISETYHEWYSSCWNEDCPGAEFNKHKDFDICISRIISTLPYDILKIR